VNKQQWIDKEVDWHVIRTLDVASDGRMCYRLYYTEGSGVVEPNISVVLVPAEVYEFDLEQLSLLFNACKEAKQELSRLRRTLLPAYEGKVREPDNDIIKSLVAALIEATSGMARKVTSEQSWIDSPPGNGYYWYVEPEGLYCIPELVEVSTLLIHGTAYLRIEFLGFEHEEETLDKDKYPGKWLPMPIPSSSFSEYPGWHREEVSCEK